MRNFIKKYLRAMIGYFTHDTNVLGRWTYVIGDNKLVAIKLPAHDFLEFKNYLEKTHKFEQLIEDNAHPVLIQTHQEIQEYLESKRKEFTIPYNLEIFGTKFEQKVWKYLETISYGKTVSYSDVAHQLSNTSARAIGNAVGKNPLAPIIPCHRVIGKNGSLTGYGGGLKMKEYLLNLETKKKHKDLNAFI